MGRQTRRVKSVCWRPARTCSLVWGGGRLAVRAGCRRRHTQGELRCRVCARRCAAGQRLQAARRRRRRRAVCDADLVERREFCRDARAFLASRRGAPGMQMQVPLDGAGARGLWAHCPPHTSDCWRSACNACIPLRCPSAQHQRQSGKVEVQRTVQGHGKGPRLAGLLACACISKASGRLSRMRTQTGEQSLCESAFAACCLGGACHLQ